MIEAEEDIYQRHGIQFRYPTHWELSEQSDAGRVTITVASPFTSFWSLYLFFDRPSPRSVMDSVIDAFESEYDELDIYPTRARLCDHKALARDFEFVCLELLNSAWARVFRTESFTALVLYQANDSELSGSQPIFERMTQSLSCAEQTPAGELPLPDESESESEDD